MRSCPHNQVRRTVASELEVTKSPPLVNRYDGPIGSNWYSRLQNSESWRSGWWHNLLKKACLRTWDIRLLEGHGYIIKIELPQTKFESENCQCHVIHCHVTRLVLLVGRFNESSLEESVAYLIPAVVVELEGVAVASQMHWPELHPSQAFFVFL